MKRNSMIEMQSIYQTPRVKEVAFESEGHICGSVVTGEGFGAGGFEGEDDSDIDFF